MTKDKYFIPVNATTDFSKGYLADDLKYRLLMSRKPTAKELDTLIKKIQMDRDIIADSETSEVTIG